MSTTDKAAEALLLADVIEYGSLLGGEKAAAASMLREYAALLQAQPVACLVENESAIMAWPITCLDEARTYCDEGEEPVLLYTHSQPAEAGRVPLTDEQEVALWRRAAEHIQRLEAENAKAGEIIDQLCACHDEPECPAVAVAREWLADAAMTKEQKT